MACSHSVVWEYRLRDRVTPYDDNWYTHYYAVRSRLDGDLQGSSAVHFVQRLLVVLELKDVGDLIHKLQDYSPRLSNDENAPFPWS